MSTRWPTRRLTIETLDYRGDVRATRTVWGRVYGAGTAVALEDTGQAELISRRPLVARADTRGDSAQVGERLTDDRGRVWTITGVGTSDSDWGGGQVLELESDIAGAG